MRPDLGVVFSAAHTRGGVEGVALQVVTHFGRTHETTFIGEELQGSPPGVTFRRLSTSERPRATRPWRFRRAAAAVLAAGRPSTVISFGANCPPGEVYWVQSVHRAWLENSSAVRVRGVAVPGHARRLLLRHQMLLHLERQYFTEHRPRVVLCTSVREAADLRRLYGVPSDVLRVVPNGYDGRRFRASDRPLLRASARGQMRIADGEISLLFVANELHRKGFGVLLDAVAQTADPRLRVDLVGRAAPDDYAALVRRLGLVGRIHWHGPTAQVQHAMAAGDLLVLPTRYEPFGLVIIEALACGLPVIASALAGASSAVHPGAGLLLDQPDDARELAGLLTQALKPGVLRAWSDAAPLSALPYEWSRVLAAATPLIFGTA